MEAQLDKLGSVMDGVMESGLFRDEAMPSPAMHTGVDDVSVWDVAWGGSLSDGGGFEAAAK